MKLSGIPALYFKWGMLKLHSDAKHYMKGFPTVMAASKEKCLILKENYKGCKTKKKVKEKSFNLKVDYKDFKLL